MGTRFSSFFSSAFAEKSPSTVVDKVDEMEAMTTMGASTSGRSEYYSKRCEAMMRSRVQFSDNVALQIEFSKPHRSEVSRLEVAPQSAEEEELNRENMKLLKQMEEEYPLLFRSYQHRHVLGRMIAKGGQAEIYEVEGADNVLMKVFQRGTLLRDLRQLWPLPVLSRDVYHCIQYAGMLENGRFMFVMEKCWGDLRKLIDQAMQEKNVKGIQGPPFPYKWKDFNLLERWTSHSADFMLGIAIHMRELHNSGVSHRDLKASNILLRLNLIDGSVSYSRNYHTGILVADFECSIGVLGTGFWRAPEVLSTLENHETLTSEQWKQADVYSYGMICFEIVTGRIPFDGELGKTKADCRLVIEGRRPQLPSDLDDAVEDLITKCWESNPSLRPTFSEIVEMVETISTRQCQFRLFDIGDDLPLQYHLATVKEVSEHSFALRQAMPSAEIANLANGSVDGHLYGMEIRSRRLNYVDYKLARLHH